MALSTFILFGLKMEKPSGIDSECLECIVGFHEYQQYSLVIDCSESIKHSIK